MKKTALTLALLLCLTPISARAEAFPIEASLNGNERSYEWQTLSNAVLYEIDMGVRTQINEARIPEETVNALRAQGIDEIQYRLPWLTAAIDLTTLTIPEHNDALRLTVTGIEPTDYMRAKWRAYRPAKLTDPFSLDLTAEFTKITLAPGVLGIPRPDPDPVSGAALGFRTEIRYPYGRDRIRVLRWNGDDFVDIPSANWDIFTEDGRTYVEGFRLEPGIYTVIDGKSL